MSKECEITTLQKELNDFPKALDDYQNLSEGFLASSADTVSGWFGWRSAIGMDKVLSANGEENAVGVDNDNYGTVVECPKSGIIEIESRFESIHNIPLGNLPVAISTVNRLRNTLVSEVMLDDQGWAEVTGLTPGQRYQIQIDQNPSEAQVQALFAAYKPMTTELKKWLAGHWDEMRPQWQQHRSDGLDASKYLSTFSSGLISALKNIWPDIKQLAQTLSDPEALLESLGDAADSIKGAISDTPEVIQSGLLFFSDEAAIYLNARAIILYLEMLAPSALLEPLAEMGGSVLGDILLTLLQSLAVGLVAGPAAAIFLKTRLGKLLYRAKQTADRLIKVFNDCFDKIMEIIKGSIARQNQAMKAFIRSQPLTANNGKVGINTRKNGNSRLDSNSTSENKRNSASKNDNGDSSRNSDCTVTNGCPVSMVTGEELLSLDDGQLPGQLPFNWTRLYRTSAIERCTELGYGWSHSLGHRLEDSGDQVTWLDAENQSTTFPTPTEQLPLIINPMAGAALFLGNTPGERVLVKDDGQRLHFNRQGELERISDRYGHELRLERDFRGRLLAVQNTLGMSLRFDYSGALITAVTLHQQQDVQGHWQWVPVQTLARYQYNNRHQLIAATNAAGDTEHYAYDEQHIILQRTLAGGASFFWAWQGEGKQVRAVRHWSDKAQFDTRYDWDDDSRTVTLTRKDGGVQVYQHDDNARLVREVDSAGGEYFKAYNDDGQLISDTNALGQTTHYEYSSDGELVSETDALGQTTSYDYRDGRRIRATREDAIWQYGYDQQGHLNRQTDPLGRTTSYRYNRHGQVELILHPDNSQHRLTWDDNGQLIQEQTPTGDTLEYRYDILGRLRYQQSPLGLTEYQYDPVGRPVKIILPGGRTRTLAYNAYGKVTHYRDELGRITRHEYLPGQELVSRTLNPDGSSLQYRYNNSFRFVSEIINEKGESYRIDYTPTGHVQSEHTFDGRQLHYEYDAHTQLIKRTETGTAGTALTTEYERNALGAVTRKTLPDGNIIDYRYDHNGQLTGVEDGHWPLQFHYDQAGQLIREEQGWASMAYQYDPLGQLKKHTLPDGQVLDFQRQHGQLQQIDLNGHALTRHRYQSMGLESERQQGQLKSHYQYDDQGRLLQHRVQQWSDFSQQNQTRFGRSYQYDNAGRINAIQDSQRGTTQYGYDANDRLQQVRSSQSEQNEQFWHDPAGNLLLSQHSEIKRNQLRFQGDSHFTYDEFGNLTEVARGKDQQLKTRHKYDCQHRLIKTELPNGTAITYRYDAFGRRIEKTVKQNNQSEQTTEFIWDGDRLLVESNPEQNHYQSFVYEDDSHRPLALINGEGKDNATAFYYQLDHLGTPKELTDKAGDIVWAADYKAYGGIAKLRHNDISNPLRFQGQYEDEETGLYYNRHRFYNPQTGRFLNPDPSGLAGGLNAYQYTTNPVNFVDPLGLRQESGVCPGDKIISKAGDINPSKSINGRKIINSDRAGNNVETKGGVVKFDQNGFPDFVPYSQKTVRIEGLTGGMEHDVPLAMKKAGMSSYDKTEYVWHHHQDTQTMMLVPQSVHSVRKGGVAHTGGRAVIKHNTNNPNDVLNYPSPKEKL